MKTETQQPINIGPSSLKLMWGGVIGGLVILALLMCVNAYLEVIAITPMSDFGPYLLWAGIATLVLPMIYLPRYRRDLQIFKQEWRTQQASGESDLNILARQQGRILIGYTLADTPAMIGAAYYLLSADLHGGLLLVITSIILLLRYKPD